MKLQDLLEALENLPPDSEVRVVIQPNYPLEYRLKAVVPQSEIEDSYITSNKEDVIYLVIGEQIGYGSKKVFDYC